MLKNKFKIVALLSVLFVLISTFSFATDDTALANDVSNTITNTTDDTNTTDTNVVNTESSDTVTDEQNTPEILDGDLYLFDNDIVMDQYVDGNVFIFGNNIEVTGRVNGNLFACGEKITFSEDSYIIQNTYVCANEITFNGATNDLYAVCNKIDTSYDSFVIRDLRVASNTFNFNGGVGRDAFVKANNFNFVTTPDAGGLVYGNLNYSASNELSLSEDFVQGSVNYSKLEQDSTKGVVLNKLINFCETILYTVVIFLLIVWLAPQFVQKASSFIGKKSILYFGIGILTCIVGVVLSFALLFSYVGFSVSLAIFTLLMLLLSIGFAVTATSITYKVKEKFKFEKNYFTGITLVCTTTILWILRQIPYVGLIVSCIISLFGLGIVSYYIFTRNSKKEQIQSEN